MHAIRVHEGAALVYEEVPDPEPKPGEAVVLLRVGLGDRSPMQRPPWSEMEFGERFGKLVLTID